MRDVGELKLNRDDTPKDETSASWHDCPVHPGQLWGRRARPCWPRRHVRRTWDGRQWDAITWVCGRTNYHGLRAV